MNKGQKTGFKVDDLCRGVWRYARSAGAGPCAGPVVDGGDCPGFTNSRWFTTDGAKRSSRIGTVPVHACSTPELRPFAAARNLPPLELPTVGAQARGGEGELCASEPSFPKSANRESRKNRSLSLVSGSSLASLLSKCKLASLTPALPIFSLFSQSYARNCCLLRLIYQVMEVEHECCIA